MSPPYGKVAAHYNNWGLAKFHMKMYDDAIEDFDIAVAIETNEQSQKNPNIEGNGDHDGYMSHEQRENMEIMRQ